MVGWPRLSTSCCVERPHGNWTTKTFENIFGCSGIFVWQSPAWRPWTNVIWPKKKATGETGMLWSWQTICIQNKTPIRMRSKTNGYSILWFTFVTVDGRNLAPPGVSKTLYIMGLTTCVRFKYIYLKCHWSQQGFAIKWPSWGNCSWKSTSRVQ